MSREFVSKLLSSEYFDLTGYIHSDAGIREYLDHHKAQSVLVIPKDYSKTLGRGNEEKLQILIDGVNGNTASVIMNYMNIAAMSYSADQEKKLRQLRAESFTR
jgi:ABC-2 type transport system permease protein